LNSDLLVAGISGNFKMAEVTRDIKKLWEDYYSIVTNAEVKENKAFADELNEYSIDLNVDLKDPNPIINLIDPSLSISIDTQLEGALCRSGEDSILNLRSSMHTGCYEGNYLRPNNVDFDTSKIRDSKEVLPAFYTVSKNQRLNSGRSFHDFSLEAIWNES